jgi:predicted RNase H-like HicB family nuclease
MKYGIILERIVDDDFPVDYYYAHIPSLGLTTHGKGIEGAMIAAKDLVTIWIEEMKSNNEKIKYPSESFYSTLEIEEYAL